MSGYTYTSTFLHKKLAILNTVLIFCYLLYLSCFIWFCADFFINTYSTDFNTAETIGMFLFICSIICACPIILSLCLTVFKTLKMQWIVNTPTISYYPANRKKIDRYALGLVGGILAAIFLIVLFIIFFKKLLLTGFISISMAFLGIIIANIINIILSKSYKLI